MAKPFIFSEGNKLRIYKRIMAGESMRALARELNVSHPTIINIKNEIENKNNEQEK
ncbi:hypothetical protein AAEJ42_13625 [Shewanella algae]|uniref:hypothetical protein n=1 Tax=Shewanella algae TaxID=38313 RepID=UPI00313DFEE4